MKSKQGIFIIAGLTGFIAVLILMLLGLTQGIDEQIHSEVLALHGSFLDGVFRFFAHSGDVIVYVIIGIFLLIIPGTRFSYGIPFAVTGLSSGAIYEIIKYIVKRPRPDLTDALVSAKNYSFPSGHAQNSFAIWGMIICLIFYYYKHKGASLPIYKKKPHPTSFYFKDDRAMVLMSALFVFFIWFISLARIYVGVHWPSDVLAGWFMGLATCSFYNKIFIASA